MSKTVVVIGQNHWGKGTREEAKLNFRKQGGQLRRGYHVLTFGPDSQFQGVDAMGFVHWTGEDPTIEEVKAK